MQGGKAILSVALRSRNLVKVKSHTSHQGSLTGFLWHNATESIATPPLHGRLVHRMQGESSNTFSCFMLQKPGYAPLVAGVRLYLKLPSHCIANSKNETVVVHLRLFLCLLFNFLLILNYMFRSGYPIAVHFIMLLL